MRRLRLLAAVAVLATTATAFRLSAPDCAAACSCAELGPLQAYLRDPNVVLLVGNVTHTDPPNGQAGGTIRGTLAVQRVFKGPVGGPQIAIEGGDGAACGIGIATGQTLIFVGYMEGGVVRPSLCSPHAELQSLEGQALLAQAQALVGPGTGVTPTAEPAPAPGDAGFLATAGWALLLAAAIAVPILLLVVLLGRRSARRQAPGPDAGP